MLKVSQEANGIRCLKHRDPASLVRIQPHQFNEKTTRLPLPEDRRSAVEWGHEAPLFISLERIQQC